MPLQDLMGYMRTDFTAAAAGSSSVPPPVPRREERKDAAFSIDRWLAPCARQQQHVEWSGNGESAATTRLFMGFLGALSNLAGLHLRLAPRGVRFCFWLEP